MSPGALLLPSLATMVSWESDQRLGVSGPAHSCHTVTTTGRPRDTDTDRDTDTEGERDEADGIVEMKIGGGGGERR